MSNLDGDGPSPVVRMLRSPLEAWVQWDCAHVVPLVQRVLGVLTPEKVRKCLRVLCTEAERGNSVKQILLLIYL